MLEVLHILLRQLLALLRTRRLIRLETEEMEPMAPQTMLKAGHFMYSALQVRPECGEGWKEPTDLWSGTRPKWSCSKKGAGLGEVPTRPLGKHAVVELSSRVKPPRHQLS